jgi:hypothetical protein
MSAAGGGTSAAGIVYTFFSLQPLKICKVIVIQRDNLIGPDLF